MTERERRLTASAVTLVWLVIGQVVGRAYPRVTLWSIVVGVVGFLAWLFVDSRRQGRELEAHLSAIADRKRALREKRDRPIK